MSEHARNTLDQQTKDHELPAPTPLTRPAPKEKPFPVDALGETLAGAVEAIHSVVDAPIALCAQSVQAAVSLAVQGHADVQLPWPDPETVPISEFFLSIAATGARKTSTDKKATASVYNQQNSLDLHYKEKCFEHDIKKRAWDRARKAVLDNKKLTSTDVEEQLAKIGLEPVKPLEPTLLCSDPTLEGLYADLALGQPSMGLFTTEGGQFLGGYAMSKDNKTRTAASLSKLYNGEPLDRVRASSNRELPRRLPGRRCTICLAVQPEVVKGFLFDGIFSGQGFLSRFLIAYPKDNIGERYPLYKAHDDELSALKKYNKRLDEILQLTLPLEENTANVLKPRVLTLTQTARNLFDKTYNEIEAGNKSGGVTTDFRNKFMEHAVRLERICVALNQEC